jgi:hypothetical protein
MKHSRYQIDEEKTDDGTIDINDIADIYIDQPNNKTNAHN